MANWGDTPSPFSERFPLESMRSGGAIPPPSKFLVSQRYLCDTLWRQGKWVRYPPLRYYLKRVLCDMGYLALGRWGALPRPTDSLSLFKIQEKAQSQSLAGVLDAQIASDFKSNLLAIWNRLWLWSSFLPFGERKARKNTNKARSFSLLRTPNLAGKQRKKQSTKSKEYSLQKKARKSEKKARETRFGDFELLRFRLRFLPSLPQI